MKIPRFALSVRQPWAWAIIYAGKDYENRTITAMNNIVSRLNPGERLAIHAAKGMTRAEYEHAAQFMASIGVECPPAYKLLRGGIIGSVKAHRPTSIKDAHTAATLSPWFFGPRAIPLSDPIAHDFTAASGMLGIFESLSNARPGDPPDEPKKWMLPKEGEFPW